MTKNEFLDELRTSLKGELPDVEVENNIRFYDEYINSKNHDKSEELLMEQLGNPRLIAKTIVETYQISHGPLYKSVGHESAYQDANTTDSNTTYEENQSDYDTHNNRKAYNFGFHPILTWYQKLFLIIVVIMFIFLFVLIGGILIRLFFSIGIPLIIVYLFYKMIKNSMRR
jgi:uncharacterized membrane protein